MKKAIGWFAVFALLAAPAAAQVKTQPLFIIERSKNANVVHYDARLTADGKLDLKEPVVATGSWAPRTAAGRNSAGSRRRRPTASTLSRTRR